MKDKIPTVAPHIALDEMVEVGRKYGYHLQYGVQLAYWTGAEQYIITVPKPEWESEDQQKKVQEK